MINSFRRDYNWMKFNFNFDLRLHLDRVQSQENEVVGLGLRRAKQRKTRASYLSISRDRSAPQGLTLNLVFGTDRAQDWQEEGRWTWCLHHWCLMLKQS